MENETLGNKIWQNFMTDSYRNSPTHISIPLYCGRRVRLLGQSRPCLLKLMLVRIQRCSRGWVGRVLSLILRKILYGSFWLRRRRECICGNIKLFSWVQNWQQSCTIMWPTGTKRRFPCTQIKQWISYGCTVIIKSKAVNLWLNARITVDLIF